MRPHFSLSMSAHTAKEQQKTSERIRVYTSWEVGQAASEPGPWTCRICYDVTVLWYMLKTVVTSVLHNGFDFFYPAFLGNYIMYPDIFMMKKGI